MNMSISAGGRSFAGAAPAPTDNSSAANNSYRLLIANNSGYSNWGTGTGGSTTKTELGVTAGLDNYYVYNLSNTGVKIDDTQKVSWTSTALTIQDTLKIFTARSENTSYGVGRIKSVKLYDSNNTMKINLIPAQTVINNETVNGMYDTVSGHFYRSAVANTNFVAGPEACPNGGTLREYVSASGTGAQVGVPTPEHPIEPTFYHQGRMILRKVGDVADTYDASTEKITRRVGVFIAKGNEASYQYSKYKDKFCYAFLITGSSVDTAQGPFFTHFKSVNYNAVSSITNGDAFMAGYSGTYGGGFLCDDRFNSGEAWRTWLKQQYDNGTPVTVYYRLKDPVEETWTPTSYCDNGIKVATKDYVTGNHGFGPIATTLNTVITAINGIVSSTVTQATSISTLATQKQTRPDDDYTDDNNAENCPDYKQCLLVEGTDGKPHWYPIDDPFRDFAAPIVGTNTAPTSTTNASGYTQLEYVTFDGTSSTGAYVDTGLKFYTDVPNNKIRLVGDAKVYQGSDWQVLVGDLGAESAYVGTNLSNYIYYGIGFNDTSTNVTNPYQRSEYDLDAVAGTYKVKNKITNQTIVNISGIQPVLKTAAIPIFLGGFQYSGGIRPARAHMDLYSVQIYNDGTLIFDGVPCRRNSDNQIGIYDKVGRNFRTTPNGINALTPGPEVLAQDPAIPGMSWTATWAGGNGVTAGTVNGEARCTSVSGADYTATNPTKFSDLTAANQTAWNTPFNSTTFSNYNKCWCKIDGVTPTSGNDISPMGATEWVYAGIPGNNTAEACATSCSNRCKDKFIPATYPGFVKVLFGL